MGIAASVIGEQERCLSSGRNDLEYRRESECSAAPICRDVDVESLTTVSSVVYEDSLAGSKKGGKGMYDIYNLQCGVSHLVLLILINQHLPI